MEIRQTELERNIVVEVDAARKREQEGDDNP